MTAKRWCLREQTEASKSETTSSTPCLSKNCSEQLFADVLGLPAFSATSLYSFLVELKLNHYPEEFQSPCVETLQQILELLEKIKTILVVFFWCCLRVWQVSFNLIYTLAVRVPLCLKRFTSSLLSLITSSTHLYLLMPIHPSGCSSNDPSIFCSHCTTSFLHSSFQILSLNFSPVII